MTDELKDHKDSKQDKTPAIQVAPLEPPAPKRPKNAKELMSAAIDDLTNEELERRTAVIKAAQAEADLQDVKDRLDERKNKREMVRDRFESRGKELVKTARDNDKAQSLCVHLKGGLGNEPGGLAHGDDHNYALIKHILPTNQMWVRCQRCGKTWKPMLRVDFPEGVGGDESFAKSVLDYKWAISAKTNNRTSSSITFEWSSPDNNISAKQFVHDIMKDTDLR